MMKLMTKEKVSLFNKLESIVKFRMEMSMKMKIKYIPIHTPVIVPYLIFLKKVDIKHI